MGRLSLGGKAASYAGCSRRYKETTSQEEACMRWKRWIAISVGALLAGAGVATASAHLGHGNGALNAHHSNVHARAHSHHAGLSTSNTVTNGSQVSDTDNDSPE